MDTPQSHAPTDIAVTASTLDQTDLTQGRIDAESVDFSGDSAYQDDDLHSYATSLSSGVRNHTYDKYGRRYQAYKEGAYPMPNDDQEQDRLDMGHHLFKVALDGELYKAPITNPKRILDVGTGTGIWAIDMAEKFPDSEIIGNDLSPMQPTWVPTNVRFEIDDCTAEWPQRKPFDFIHVRYMCGSIRDWPQLVARCYNQTAKNGWCEFLDWDLNLYSEINPHDSNSALHKVTQLVVKACSDMGLNLRAGPLLEGWVKTAGYKNVEHQKIRIPLGPWPKDPKMKEMGAFNMLQFLQGAQAVVSIIERAFEWTSEEAQVLLAQVRNDAKKKNLYPIIDVHVVYGQRLD